MKKTPLLSLIIALFFFAGIGRTQTFFRNPIGDGYFQPGFGLQAGTFFNVKFQDIMVDFGLGYDDLGYDFSAYLNFAFRPYRKKLRIKNSPHYFYQVQGKLFEISLDLEKRFYFLSFSKGRQLGIYLGLKSGYVWGTYKGFKSPQWGPFIFSPMGGFSFQFFKAGRVSLGYMYFAARKETLFPHMINLKVNLVISGMNNEE